MALLAAYSFDEASGTILDSSGNGRNVSITSSSLTRVTGHTNTALSQSTTAADSPGPPLSGMQTAAFTIMGWIKRTSNSLDGWLMEFKQSSSGDRGFLMTGGNIQARCKNVAGTVFTVQTTQPTAGTAYHAAMTNDGTTLRLYINGTQVGTGTAFSGGVRTNSTSSSFFDTLGSETWLDDARYYDTALDAATITTLMGTPVGGSTTTPVSATRATTWTVRATVAPTRAATWDVLSARSSTRATTWDVLTRVTATRATSWDALSAATATRATTWRVRSQVTSTRATTWQTKTRVTATRSTTWRVRAAITAFRSTAWNVASTIATVVATRGTTWRVGQRVVGTRATLWGVRAAVTGTRTTTWDVTTQVALTRIATWDALASLATFRATTWRTLAQPEATRATTWAVASDLLPQTSESVLTVTNALTSALNATHPQSELPVSNAPSSRLEVSHGV